jgi:hypothetical protein
MNKQGLKNTVLEVLNEYYSSPSRPSTYSPGTYSVSSMDRDRKRKMMDDEEQENENPIGDKLQEILKNLDSDPGYEQAIAICKVLVKNKNILRDLLENLIEQQELAEEFINSLE